MSETVQVCGPREREIVVSSLGAGRSDAFNVPVFLHVTRDADLAELQRCLLVLVEACDWMRRQFRRVGHDILAIQGDPPEVLAMTVGQVHDLPSVAASARIGAVGEPLVVIRLIQVDEAPGQAYVYFNAHHALLDGLSLSRVVDAFVALYRRQVPPSLEFGLAAAGMTVQLDTEAASARQALCQAVAQHGAGAETRRQTAITPATLSSAQVLAAGVRCLAEWAELGAVFVGVPVLGRRIADMDKVGSFARLETVDVADPWAPAVGAEISASAFRRSLGTEPSVAWSGLPPVVVDPKATTLLDIDRWDRDGVRFFEDPSYRDDKYVAHLSTYARRDATALTLDSHGLAPEPLERLWASLTDALGAEKGAD